MAIKTINENYLSAIGDAIRSKNGRNEKYKPKEMAAAIEAMELGGVQIPLITGNCGYRFANDGWSWAFPYITTQDITNCNGMFKGCRDYRYQSIPFEINCKAGTSIDVSEMFANTSFLLQWDGLPKINNCKPSSMKNMFNGAERLREIPSNYFKDWDLSNTKGDCSGIFDYCINLESTPLDIFGAVEPANATNTTGCKYPRAFSDCWILREVKSLPIPEAQVSNARTTNMFVDTFSECNLLRAITFKEPGKTVKWKNQYIRLNYYVGYSHNSLEVWGSISADKQITDNATYQALKNDPDSWTKDINYSVYNRESAVNTINSLPDASAYLKEVGGTNTIVFKGDSGALTDSGAIKNLTNSEIAVATAKGWTVSFV